MRNKLWRQRLGRQPVEGLAVAYWEQPSKGRTGAALPEQGTALKVRVKDAKGLLAQHENKGAGSDSLVGVRCPSGLLQTGRVVSTDAVGRDIEMLVPVNQALKVAVMTQRFDTSDDSGKQLGLASSDLDVNLSKGQPAAAVNITITGIH